MTACHPPRRMVTVADLKTLNEATLALYTPELRLSSYPEAAFKFLSTLVGVDQINYANLDLDAGTMDVATSAMTPDWARGVEGFGLHMWKYPMTNFDPSVNDGKPFFSSDFVTQRQFRDLDLYSECFQILGVDHHGAVYIPTDEKHRLWFGLERSGPREFSEVEQRLEQAHNVDDEFLTWLEEGFEAIPPEVRCPLEGSSSAA